MLRVQVRWVGKGWPNKSFCGENVSGDVEALFTYGESISLKAE